MLSIYNHKSPSVALEDVAEPTKFMNPSTGNATIGNALTTVFLPQSPVPIVILQDLAFLVVILIVIALLLPVTFLNVLGDNPLLYNQLDKTTKINQISGVTQMHELFDVDVNLKNKEKVVRGFSYSDCRITDYIVASQHGNEESFFFWFALENTFEFECTGYDPKNPSYNIMSKSDQPEQSNNRYWQNTQQWSDEFRYIPRDKSN